VPAAACLPHCRQYTTGVAGRVVEGAASGAGVLGAVACFSLPLNSRIAPAIMKTIPRSKSTKKVAVVWSHVATCRRAAAAKVFAHTPARTIIDPARLSTPTMTRIEPTIPLIDFNCLSPPWRDHGASATLLAFNSYSFDLLRRYVGRKPDNKPMRVGLCHALIHLLDILSKREACRPGLHRSAERILKTCRTVL